MDLNKDGVPDMIRSGLALQELYDTLPDVTFINIVMKVVTPGIIA
jgi:hypothetical protein